MRKLKAFIDIKASLQTVQSLTAASRRREWLAMRNDLWLQFMDEAWQATEHEGGTRLVLEMKYRSKLPFLDSLMSEGFSVSVASSLSRLKQMAEANPQ